MDASPVTEIALTPEQTAKMSKGKAVVLNHQDLSFAKIRIDATSRQFLSTNLKNIEDILLRSLIWKNFYEMVKDGDMLIP